MDQIPTDSKSTLKDKLKNKAIFFKHSMSRISKKTYLSVLSVLFLVASLGTGLYLVGQNQNILKKASSNTTQYSGKFKEEIVLSLSKQTKIASYFDNSYRLTSKKPDSIDRGKKKSSTSTTISNLSGLIIENPAKGEPFYKIEVTLQDDNQQNLSAYIALVDSVDKINSPSRSGSVNYLSVGMNTSSSLSTYWYEHPGFKNELELTPTEQEFDKKVKNKFVVRRKGDVTIEIYVTPLGIYPVVAGANFATFPNLYQGSYIYQNPQASNYIVLGKYNSGGDKVTFKNLKVTKLDNSPSSVEDVNAYFIKKAVEAGPFKNVDPKNFANDNGIHAAAALRLYDYYYGTNNRELIGKIIDQYLAYLKGRVADATNAYNSSQGFEQIHAATHAHTSSLHHIPSFFWGLGDYVSASQRSQLKEVITPFVDALEAKITPDGAWPPPSHWVGDTYAENITWTEGFLTGYVALFPDDQPRVEKTLEYIKFLGFTHYSVGKTYKEVFGDPGFKYLSSSYANYRIQTIHPTGEVDNHNHHPSVHYSEVGMVSYIKNLLNKIGKTLNPNTVESNLQLVYNTTFKNNLDVSTLHLNKSLPTYEKAYETGQTPNIIEDCYYFTDDKGCGDLGGQDYKKAYIKDAIPNTKPSLLEDWSAIYSNYSGVENYGDYASADIYARNTYYLGYDTTGKLTCTHRGSNINTFGQYCNFDGTFYGDAVMAAFFSARSNFTPGVVVTQTAVPEAATVNPTATTTPTATAKPTNKQRLLDTKGRVKDKDR